MAVITYFRFILTLNLLLVINGFLTEDLTSLFGKEFCIEASLITTSHIQDAEVMIDKNSQSKESLLINVTKITERQYEKSATSTINELAQYNELQYSYELLSEEGAPHNKNYKVVLILGDERYENSGPSLKKAKNAAAVLALQNTLYERPPIKLQPEEEKPITPTVMLNNVAMKLGIGVAYFLMTGNNEEALSSYGSYNEAYGKSKSYFPKLNTTNSLRIPTEDSQISGPFIVKVKVGEYSFVGTGHTIQAARHNAASNALKDMQNQSLFKDNVCDNEESAEQCKEKKEKLKSPVSRVYEMAQKQNLPVEFNIVSESGKSHQKNFVTQCKLGDFVTEGDGQSKKESKNIAAEKMLENFSLIHTEISEKEIITGFKTKKNKKKKKKKLTKNNIYGFGQSINDMLTAFWQTNDVASVKRDNSKSNMKDKKHLTRPKTFSSKDNLLELANILQVQVQFSDINQHNGLFFTLMSLDVHPLHICLGKAPTRSESHNIAATHGLNFLYKIGVLKKTKSLQDDEERYSINEEYLEEDNNVLSLKHSDKISK